MNYEMQLQAKREELAKLEKEVAKQRVNAATLKAGQCYKNKPNNYTTKGYTCYQKLLYVDDSKFGYVLVIDERIIFEPLHIFQQGPNWPNDREHDDVYIPDQDVMLTIGQAYNFETDLEHLEQITEEEFAQAKAKALRLLTTSKVPSNWVEAQSFLSDNKSRSDKV